MTILTLAPYREALEREICGPCPDRLPRGGCGRPADDPCTLQTNLGPLVESVLGVRSSSLIADYETALRRSVCPECRQDAEGNCRLRGHGCKLDAFMIEVVEVIEATRDELEQLAKA